MKTDRKKINEAGFNLIELLVVMGIILIVSTLALMQFGSSKKQFSRQNVSQELKSSFERARFDSVKRRATSSAVQANVVINATSFTVTLDRNNDGDTTDTADSVTTAFSGQNINIAGVTGASLPVTVSFDQRGEAVALSGTTVVNPAFVVCNGTCTFDNDTASNANIVLVTPSGTVNLLPGGSAIPAFTAPTVTIVPTGTDIRGDVTLP